MLRVSVLCPILRVENDKLSVFKEIGVVDMFSDDFRWRAVALLHVYGVNIEYVSDVLGPTVRSLQRWYELFLRAGVE